VLFTTFYRNSFEINRINSYYTAIDLLGEELEFKANELVMKYSIFNGNWVAIEFPSFLSEFHGYSSVKRFDNLPDFYNLNRYR